VRRTAAFEEYDMSRNRTWADRFMKNVLPRPVAGFAPPPREIARDVWTLDRQLRMPGGMILPNRTTVLRLDGGSAVVVSPPPADAEAFRAVDSIGTTKWIVAPNSFHYLYAPPFAAHYPGARLLTSPGLRERVPEFPAADELGAMVPQGWDGSIDVAVLGPVRGLSESAIFHVPSKTLVVTDLAFHVTHFARGIDRIIWRLSGVPAAFGPSRTARMLLLRDRSEASRFLRQVDAWPFERIVMAHGDVVERNAKVEFAKGFAAYLGM
jgi:hypothetical protein